MLADESEEYKSTKSPSTLNGTSVSLCLYIENVDDLFKQAINAGGKTIRNVENQFYGDRAGVLSDPFGHTWCIATHIEDLSPEEFEKRIAAFEK